MNRNETADFITQELHARAASRLRQKFIKTEDGKEQTFHIFTSSNDEGVVRNGGRRGSSFGPQAIINSFKGLIAPSGDYCFQTHELCPISNGSKPESFEFSQEQSYQEWMAQLPQIQKNRFLSVHLGGGHDHIYPLLRVLNSLAQRLTIFNIDAHTDTRIDSWAHSGTPFRQFDHIATRPFTLYQYGLHPYSNPAANFTSLTKGQMHLKWRTNSDREHADHFKKYFENCDIAILSLDADALDSSEMEAVSAVNPDGLNKREIRCILDAFKLSPAAIKIFGIYEYNPLFDNLSQKGQRYLASLLYHLFF